MKFWLTPLCYLVTQLRTPPPRAVALNLFGSVESWTPKVSITTTCGSLNHSKTGVNGYITLLL